MLVTDDWLKVAIVARLLLLLGLAYFFDPSLLIRIIDTPIE